MSKYKYKVIGIPVSGYEEDYIEPLVDPAEDEANISTGISGLLGKADVCCISPSCLYGFEYAKLNDADDTAPHWKAAREEYKKQSGREYPFVYKIKISVEAEPLSEEESKKLWEDHAEKYKD